MSIHPNKLLIATGQGAGVDKAHVRIWNSVSLQTLHVLGSQEFDDRSICCLSFSKVSIHSLTKKKLKRLRGLDTLPLYKLTK